MSSSLLRVLLGDRATAIPVAAELARSLHASARLLSCDPVSPVGSLAVGPDGFIQGFNRLPAAVRGRADPRMLGRPLKYEWIVHAECEAVHAAARNGLRLAGGVLVGTKFPCHACVRALQGAGVRRVLSPDGPDDHPRWGDSFRLAREMMAATGLEWLEIPDVRRYPPPGASQGG